MKRERKATTGNVVRCVCTGYETNKIASYFRVIKKIKIGSNTIYRCMNTYDTKTLQLDQDGLDQFGLVDVNEYSVINVITTIPVYIQKSVLDRVVYILTSIGITTKSYADLYIPINKRIEKNRDVLIENNKSTHMLMLYNIDDKNNKTYRVYVHYDDVMFVSRKEVTGERRYYMKLIGARFAQPHAITPNQCNK